MGAKPLHPDLCFLFVICQAYHKCYFLHLEPWKDITSPATSLRRTENSVKDEQIGVGHRHASGMIHCVWYTGVSVCV